MLRNLCRTSDPSPSSSSDSADLLALKLSRQMLQILCLLAFEIELLGDSAALLAFEIELSNASASFLHVELELLNASATLLAFEIELSQGFS